MKGLTIFTCLVLIICVLCSFLPLSDEAEIYDNTVRLHVIANSDSEYDQNVKLRVRDGVLSLIEELVKDAENIEEAENIIRENISAIRDSSRETLNLLGEAKGKNWWCVLYPELCTGGAKTGETLVKTGFSKDQIDILTGKDKPEYKLKFKFLELFEKSFSQ